MSLDAGSVSRIPSVVFDAGAIPVRSRVFDRWNDWEPSRISHHGRACCETAREWLVAIDQSALNGAQALTGPRWLRSRFEWGPSQYPIHWCEAVTKKTLDCGVLAALAHEIFISRGVRCYRAQLVQRFSAAAAEQWLESWDAGHGVTAWINDDLIYHEGCAIPFRDGELKLWDSSAGWWIDPKATSGYGSLLAVRISSYPAEERPLVWGTNEIYPNAWTEL